MKAMSSSARLIYRSFALLFSISFLMGCSEIMLYNQLDEQQANEIIAVLVRGGVSAEKKNSGDTQWSVGISKSDFATSMELLEKSGLPRAPYRSMGELFKKEGFIASPLEERTRLRAALSQELENTILNIDGVVTARVHVAIPEKENFSENAQPSSVSVFIKHRSGVDLQSSIPQIKSLVLNGIEGVVYDRISVSMFRTEPQLPIQPDTPTPLITKTSIFHFIVIVILLILMFIGWQKRFFLLLWFRNIFTKTFKI
jgi:type III secretion protein J